MDMFKPRQRFDRKQAAHCRANGVPRTSRRGLTSMELLVSVVILVATVTAVTSLIFKCGMIWKDISHRRVAVRELSSQLEELTLLDRDSAEEGIKQLKLSDVCKERLPEARLTGVLSEDNLGVRIQLSLNWKRLVESKPVVLCGWLIEPEETQ